jgi:MoxR-like ATPase
MADPATPETRPDDLAAIQKLKGAYDRIRAEMAKVIVGQDRVLEELLTALFSRGHALLVGVPGLAKTLMVKTVSQCFNLTFNRIQFTPDLMPSDITGTEVIYDDKATGERTLRFIKGPVFANVILADEINRTPPKTQAALLEAMQELQVTVGGRKYALEHPFFVLATQNPIEQEGTYPLPEAQLDRFMFHILVDYPTEQEEIEILRLTTAAPVAALTQIISREEILQLQEIVRRVPVADAVLRYAASLARATRVKQENVPPFVTEWVQWGAGPRASQYLVVGAKARAVLQGRAYVSSEDVRAVAHPVLRHRILTNFSAEAEGVTADHIVDKLLQVIPAADSPVLRDAKLPQVLGTGETK